MQRLAEQFAQCADVQEQVDFIGTLLGGYDPVRIADRDKYEACSREQDRLLHNWARRERHRTAKTWQETGERVAYGPKPDLPCTCGYPTVVIKE